jgi:hypothetical protein
MAEIMAVLSIFVILPGIIFTFVYKNKKNKNELKKLEYEKEILQLEIEKGKTSPNRSVCVSGLRPSRVPFA